MDIRLAKIDDIELIMAILKERCDWLRANNINQWANNYLERYNENYFSEVMKLHKLYVVSQENKVIGVFLLKEEDKTYWKNDDSAYYIHHLATRIGYSGVGTKIIQFIEQLARKNSKKYIRLDCKKSNNELNQYYQKQGFIYKGTGEEPYSYNLWEKEVQYEKRYIRVL